MAPFGLKLLGNVFHPGGRGRFSDAPLQPSFGWAARWAGGPFQINGDRPMTQLSAEVGRYRLFVIDGVFLFEIDRYPCVCVYVRVCGRCVSRSPL